MTDTKTPQEIQALKENWLKDPCWDIESTEGFEFHVEELLNFRRQTEAEWTAEKLQCEKTRADYVHEQTGVIDTNIVSALKTWNEIERLVSDQDEYIGGCGTRAEVVMAELQVAQIRATLLQAAQLKRIADTLESIDLGDRLAETVAMWGCGNE